MRNSILKIMFVMIVILITSVSMVIAQTFGFIEQETNISNGEMRPLLNFRVQGNISHGFGWFAWSSTSRVWSEAYTGFTYSPALWCQIGAALGLETADNPLRFGSFIWLGNGKIYFLGIYENGGSGPWHRTILNYRSGNFGFGTLEQSSIGLGPRVEYNIKKFQIWAATTFRKNNYATVLSGIRFHF